MTTDLTGQGVLPNGVRWVRNRNGHVWYGRAGGTGKYPDDLAVVKQIRWVVRLNPPIKPRKETIKLLGSDGKMCGSETVVRRDPDEWTVACDTVSRLAAAGVDPGVLLDALMDAYQEAWNLV